MVAFLQVVPKVTVCYEFTFTDWEKERSACTPDQIPAVDAKHAWETGFPMLAMLSQLSANLANADQPATLEQMRAWTLMLLQAERRRIQEALENSNIIAKVPGLYDKAPTVPGLNY